MAVHWHDINAYALTKADRKTIKDSFTADKDKLTAIIDTPPSTDNQRTDAIKDEAQVSRRLLRAVKALVL